MNTAWNSGKNLFRWTDSELRYCLDSLWFKLCPQLHYPLELLAYPERLKISFSHTLLKCLHLPKLLDCEKAHVQKLSARLPCTHYWGLYSCQWNSPASSLVLRDQRHDVLPHRFTWNRLWQQMKASSSSYFPAICTKQFNYYERVSIC